MTPGKTIRIVAALASIAPVATQVACAQDAVTMPAVQRHIVQTFSAPARVQAASNLVLTVSTPGTIADLHILPGDAVRQGQRIARLTGPVVVAETARLNAEQKSAQIRASYATQAAGIERQKLGDQLGTRDSVLHMESDRDTAQQQLATARAAATSYQSQLSVFAPLAGIVTAVSAADGESVSAAQAIATIAPSNGLYVVASFYGDDAARVMPGTEGTFAPEGSPTPLHVTVRRTSANPATPGETDVWLKPSDGRTLPAAAAGSLTLTQTTEKLAVPASALVLDDGQWWVLVHDGQGEHRRQVVPGISDNGWTAILRGLAPYEKVVVQDAYLLFHQDFAKQYQQAD